MTDWSALTERLAREILNRAGVIDRDDFVHRLAIQCAAFSDGYAVDDALRRALRSTATTTFRSRGITRQEFDDSLITGVTEQVLLKATSFRDLLMEFAEHAESKLARAMKRDKSEEFVRSNLLSHLFKYGPVDREAHEGAGQTDVIFSFHGRAPRYLCEVKVPHGQTEFADGLIEAAAYAKTMRVDHVYYLFVDHCPDLDAPRFQQAPVAEFKQDGIAITSVRILVSDVAPSATGRARRQR